MNKKISPAIFLIALFCLILPFVTVSCGGQEMAKLNGIEFVTGTNVEGEDISPNPVAIAILIAGIAGVRLGFWKNKNRLLGSSLAGVAGFILTIALKMGIEKEIRKNGMGINVTFNSGFYMMTLSYLAAALYNAYEINKRKISSFAPPRKFADTGVNPSEASQSESAQDKKYCSQCGTANTKISDFCSECGTKFV